MAEARLGPRAEAPTFSAALPWIGPIVGAVPADATDGARFPLAGAVDPALMLAFGAAFIPVVEIDKQFVPANRDGEQGSVKDVAWVQPAERDPHGWFRISAPVERWRGRIDGVLVVLLYNESRDLGAGTFAKAFPGAFEVVLAEQAGEIEEELIHAQMKAAKAAGARSLGPIPFPPVDRVVTGIARALARLLKTKSAAKLRRGLSEVHSPAAKDEVTFALASCQYPSGLLEEECASASYRRLGTILDREKGAGRPQGLLLVGDQVYVDGTAGLFDPTAGFDRFVRPYEIFHRHEAVRDVTRRMPTYMLLDDHEIADNWEPRSDDVRPDPMMVEGRRSYLKFERAAGPEPERPVGDSTDPMWYPFELNGFDFFMADTRTERDPRTVCEIDRASIMRQAQWARLRAFLCTPPFDKPRFVASPSILLPRHRRAIEPDARASALHSDGWDGYPASLYGLLTLLAVHQAKNVIFLSGDEHLSCVARATITSAIGPPVVFHSVHSSALFAPFPFANSIRDDLAVPDAFEFDMRLDGRSVRAKCTVDTTFADPGDGFALLRVFRKSAASGWTLRCSFDREREPIGPPPPLEYPL